MEKSAQKINNWNEKQIRLKKQRPFKENSETNLLKYQNNFFFFFYWINILHVAGCCLQLPTKGKEYMY